MELQTIGMGVIYIVLGVTVLFLAKLIKDVVTPFRVDEELTGRDNPAYGLVLSGYFAGVTIVFLGATIGPDLERPLDLAKVASAVATDFAYSLGGIFAMLLGRIVLDRLVLTKFNTQKEIIEDRNVGTGAVEAGALVATALTVAGAVHGEGGGPMSALIFFVLGQLVLMFYVAIYQLVTKYDVHREIEQDNVAAGVALGMNMIAVAIVLLKGIAGDLVDWQDKLTWFAVDVTVGVTLLLGLRTVTDVLFLPNTTIGHEIAHDRNLNAAWIEGIMAISVASMIFFIV